MTAGTQRIKMKLKDGGPWGFRLQGGPGTGSPLTVSKVRRRSKAYNKLLEGDLLLTVNGISCTHLTYDQVMAIADKTGSEFNLEVEREAKRETALKTPAHAYQNSSLRNTPMKMTESETMITECSTSNNVNSHKAPISSIQPQPAISRISQFDEIAATSQKKIKPAEDSLEIESQQPEITSEMSTEISSEVTSGAMKREKVETERIHEKHKNKNTTIIRTGYEKHEEKTEVSPSDNTCDKAVVEDIAKIIEHLDTEYNKTASELYEVHKTEKTEITTKTLNGTLSSEISLPPVSSSALDSIFADIKNISKQLENEHLLTSPVSSTLETYSEVTDDSGSSMISKKKKMFSSSSFYEEPHAIYPTVEEQFEMAKKIAESLADDTNKKSKGANMFFKRAKRSTKWIHEGPEPSSESAPDTPEIQETTMAEFFSSKNGNGHKKFPKLKLVLDPRHPVDLASLRSTGHNISEHNVISPEVCHGLVRDLESPVGKGSALFAKRKKKSSEWVVDEEKVKALMEAHERDLNQVKQNQSNIETPKTPYFKSPWDTAAYVSPMSKINPDKLAETVIAAADVKRKDSLQMLEDNTYETCRSPITPAASYYDIYKAKAPRGWSASPAAIGALSPVASTTTSSYLPHTEPFPAYSTLTTPSYGKKFNFQNFNTLPRKWKARN